MKNYELKDKILKYMIGHQSVQTYTMAEELKIDHQKCLMLLKEMHEDDELVKLPERIRTNQLNHITNLLNKGEVFISKGGYTSQRKRNIISFLRKNFFNFLTAVFSIATIILMYQQNQLSNTAKTLEVKNGKLQMQIDSLRALPQFQKHDTTTQKVIPSPNVTQEKVQ